MASPTKQKWGRWVGGEPPAPPFALVEVTFRDKTVSLEVTVESLDWYHSGTGLDIVKYRMVNG